MHRTSGILLHPTSLPGPHGIGDLGPAARRFVDFLAEAGQGLWQVLPIGPTGYGDSPYQCTSAFAGNPLLVSPERIVEAGWLDTDSLEHPPFPADRVDFGAVKAWKRALFERAYLGFLARADQSDRDAFARFAETERDWLDPYVLYTAIKSEQGHRPWTDWPEPLALRDPETLARWSEEHRSLIDRHRFVQYLFARQWADLKAYANARGVRLVGDAPIFVAHDSAEVWTHRDWFQLDERGHPTVVAGVPPDYFSATGQRWGNPLYRWDTLAADGYAFWVTRLRRALDLHDLVRIDHFRGFAGYWEIPASEPTAIGGRWVPGPGMDLFRALKSRLGEELPLIAEDLGVITPDVEALRDELELPGMAILQFGFEDLADGRGTSSYLPHNHRRCLAVYTGTHDNNTLAGWWAEKDPELRERVRRYLGGNGAGVEWDFIRAALSSVADMAIFPLQDVLALGPWACMNRPGNPHGNWAWRFTEDQLDSAAAARLAELARLCGREPYAAVAHGHESAGPAYDSAALARAASASPAGEGPFA